ncbi:4'-phosphopantetheinyl transferase family protein [Roseospira navarrensis]|uniref:4'-phosphopantetheinyl transferase superfamily protein n=1 Tax=Roseospira navarrensis TaxID=140058 RepID=A0A7X2D408_9PROT|nr:4'-phosphopantetheinyl transferase superfamily protein [Roseospira navarrensis]MQX35695.1 4'-phosphopantetheinyl transferase superfamily protein [Roseospira navarrensis]
MRKSPSETLAERRLFWHDRTGVHNPAAARDVVRVRWLPVAAVAAHQWPQLAALLDEAERDRAGRFHFEHDRRVFTLAHALARAVLTVAAGGAPAPSAWRFTEGAQGKPEAVCPPGCPRLRLNLSHTRGLAAVALAVDHDVGLDVEWAGRPASSLDLVDPFFAPSEAAAVRAAPEVARLDTFLALWTLKEAVVKAVGTGLSQALDSFAFTLDPLSLRFAHGRDTADRWLVRRLDPGPDHRMALAVRCETPDRLRVDAAAASLADVLALAS